jgi:cytochrome c556
MKKHLLVAALVLAPACFKPRDSKLDEIPKLASLAEVMQANETIAGPQWKMIGDESYEADDWTRASDASARLVALSERAKEFSRGEAFDKHRANWEGHAKALGAAAEKKDAAAASKALEDLKATCKACHAETR